MAVDEALLESAIEHGGRVTLRLYRFARPTMTVGYGQDLETACRLPACDDEGVEIVRRPTGGRALLHEHETTYSVTGPRLAASPRDVYERVSGAIQQGLETLGVPTDPAKPAAADPLPAATPALPCLAAPTGHEIASGGRKLVPSAMRFRREGFLLHGSLLWRVDAARWRRLTHLPTDRELPAVGLEELGIGPVDEDQLEIALATAISRRVLAPRATAR